MARNSTRIGSLAAATVITALALTGCSGGAGGSGGSGGSGGDSGSGGDGGSGIAAVKFDTATEPTPGNAALPIGAPANVTTDDGGASALISILQIDKGDPKIFDQWDNGEEFEGKTPYYVIMQSTATAGDPGQFAIFPTDQDGKPVEYVVNMLGQTEVASGTADCPIDLPKAKEGDTTTLTCIIGLADKGEEVTGGVYNGDVYSTSFAVPSFGDGGTYGNSPITWSPDAPETITYDAEAIDMSTPGAATAPGTTVAIGQPAWLPMPDATDTLVGTSVLKIVEGDNTYFERYENAADFAADTPTFVVLQFEYPDAATAEEGEFPPLFPILADGSDASWMPAMGGFSISGAPGLNMCPLVLPLNDPESTTRIGCMVTMGQGQAVTGMDYVGESYSAIIANDELGYFSSPVTFR